MSSLIALYLMMIISSTLVLFSNSWLFIWIFLEMNTLSFCFIASKEHNPLKGSSESVMKYFIIQSIASTLLIFSGYFSNELILSKVLVLASVFSIMIKIGASPTHNWFIQMTQSISWKTNLILMTWQKGAPAYLLIFQMKCLLMPFIVMSAFVGSFFQINKKRVILMLAYSSVFNLSWMIMAGILSFKIWAIFNLIYWVSVLVLIDILVLEKIKTSDDASQSMKSKWVKLLFLMNMGGFPPFSNFVAKWLILTTSMKITIYLTALSMLTVSSVNLFVYLRVFSEAFMKVSMKTQKSSEHQKKMIMAKLGIVSFLPVSLVFV